MKRSAAPLLSPALRCAHRPFPDVFREVYVRDEMFSDEEEDEEEESIYGTVVNRVAGRRALQRAHPAAVPDHDDSGDDDDADYMGLDYEENDRNEGLYGDCSEAIYDVVVTASARRRGGRKPPTDKRGHVLDELIATEDAYAEALRKTVKAYIEPMQVRVRSPLISADDLATIFINFSELVPVHDEHVCCVLLPHICTNTI